MADDPDDNTAPIDTSELSRSLHNFLDVDNSFDSPKGLPSWKNRRHLIYYSLLFCAFCILYCMIKGTDTRLAETIVTNAFLLAGALIGFFIGSKTYQDVKFQNISAATANRKTRVVSSDKIKQPMPVTPAPEIKIDQPPVIDNKG